MFCLFLRSLNVPAKRTHSHHICTQRYILVENTSNLLIIDVNLINHPFLVIIYNQSAASVYTFHSTFMSAGLSKKTPNFSQPSGTLTIGT